MLESEILDVVFIKIRDNLPAELPAGRIFTVTTNPAGQTVDTPKVVLYLEPANSGITTLGSSEVCRRFERTGSVRIVVHTPTVTNADIKAVIIAEKIQALFEGNAEDAPLHYDNVSIREPRRDGDSWVNQVVITYRLDVVK